MQVHQFCDLFKTLKLKNHEIQKPTQKTDWQSCPSQFLIWRQNGLKHKINGGRKKKIVKPAIMEMRNFSFLRTLYVIKYDWKVFLLTVLRKKEEKILLPFYILNNNKVHKYMHVYKQNKVFKQRAL